MSFEYSGAFQAMSFLRDNGASNDQAEAVGEAIIRNADLAETGTLTSLAMVVQLSTVFGEFVHVVFFCENVTCNCRRRWAAIDPEAAPRHPEFTQSTSALHLAPLSTSETQDQTTRRDMHTASLLDHGCAANVPPRDQSC
jgi:hypothetical protein